MFKTFFGHMFVIYYNYKHSFNSTCNVHRLDLLHTDGASLASS